MTHIVESIIALVDSGVSRRHANTYGVGAALLISCQGVRITDVNASTSAIRVPIKDVSTITGAIRGRVAKDQLHKIFHSLLFKQCANTSGISPAMLVANQVPTIL